MLHVKHLRPLRLFLGMLHVKQSELQARARVGLEGILNRL